MSSRLADAYARRAAEAAATMPRFSVSLDAAPVELEDVVAALRAVPALNVAWRDGAVAPYGAVGVAVLLPGPIAPVVADSAALAAARARDPESFTAAELAGATFTVIFAPEVDSAEPLLVPRQAAVLGVGRSRLTLACDARAVSVADASDFLRSLAQR